MRKSWGYGDQLWIIGGLTDPPVRGDRWIIVEQAALCVRYTDIRVINRSALLRVDLGVLFLHFVVVVAVVVVFVVVVVLLLLLLLLLLLIIIIIIIIIILSIILTYPIFSRTGPEAILVRGPVSIEIH